MEVFFYGLFMDSNILQENGVTPSNPRKGYLNNYTLKIGKRASLVPSVGERSYGILMTVEKNEIDLLYSEPSVADYIPEEIDVFLENGETVKAICYNLPLEQLTGTNQSYAQTLYKLALGKGFPKDYLNRIKLMGNF